LGKPGEKKEELRSPWVKKKGKTKTQLRRGKKGVLKPMGGLGKPPGGGYKAVNKRGKGG